MRLSLAATRRLLDVDFSFSFFSLLLFSFPSLPPSLSLSRTLSRACSFSSFADLRARSFRACVIVLSFSLSTAMSFLFRFVVLVRRYIKHIGSGFAAQYDKHISGVRTTASGGERETSGKGKERGTRREKGRSLLFFFSLLFSFFFFLSRPPSLSSRHQEKISRGGTRYRSPFARSCLDSPGPGGLRRGRSLFLVCFFHYIAFIFISLNKRLVTTVTSLLFHSFLFVGSQSSWPLIGLVS